MPYKVFKENYDPLVEEPEISVRVEERSMWCVVRNGLVSKWGDTDKYMCEVEGHKIGGKDGCKFRTILVLED